MLSISYSELLCLGIAIILICLVAVFEYLRVTKNSFYLSVYETLRKHSFVFFLFLLLFICGIVYCNFIVFRKIYVYSYDIASDSYYQNFPMIIHLSDYIKSDGFPFWSFNVGLGQNIFATSFIEPFTLFVIQFGRNAVPYLLGYEQILKVVLAAVFFYGYLHTMKLAKYSCIVGGLLYAFCGEIIARGGWFGYPSEVVAVAILLFSFELLLMRNKTWVLPLGALSMALLLRGYYIVLFSMLIFAYGIFRYVMIYKFKPKAFFKFFIRVFLYYIIGIGISAVVTLPSLYYIINSPRVSGSHSTLKTLMHSSIFALNSFKEYATIFFRSIQSDIMGVGSKFTGFHNYLEAPLFYCGLLTLLLLPQIFRFFDFKTKIMHGIIIGVTIFYLVSKYFRLALNGFSGDYYKISGFFIVIVWLFIMVKALQMIIHTRSVNIPLLIITSAALIAPIIIAIITIPSHMDKEVAFSAILFLVIYTVLLILLDKSPQRLRTVQAAILALVVFETLFFSYHTVNDRVTLTSLDINSKNGYYDASNMAVEFINNRDNGFYRVDKDYLSVYLNDSLIQGYYGTKTYQSFNSNGSVEFYDRMKQKMTGASYLFGFDNDILLDTFVSVKYCLSKDPNFSMTGYKKIGSANGINIYENQNFLPLGFTYSKYILYSDFTKLTQAQKELTLLNALVIDDGTDIPRGLQRTYGVTVSGESSSPAYITAYESSSNDLKRECLNMTYHSQNKIDGNITVSSDRELFFSIPYDKGWSIKVDGKQVKAENVNMGFTGFAITKGSHSVELNYLPPLLPVSIVISIVSFVIFFALTGLYVYKKHIKKSGNINNLSAATSL